jgi:hypothetical protein
MYRQRLTSGIILTALLLSGTGCTTSVVVVGEDTGAPIKGASVEMINPPFFDKTKTTDANGEVTFSTNDGTIDFNNTGGVDVEVKVNATNYLPADQPYTITQSGSVKTISLVPSASLQFNTYIGDPTQGSTTALPGVGISVTQTQPSIQLNGTTQALSSTSPQASLTFPSAVAAKTPFFYTLIIPFGFDFVSASLPSGTKTAARGDTTTVNIQLQPTQQQQTVTVEFQTSAIGSDGTPFAIPAQITITSPPNNNFGTINPNMRQGDHWFADVPGFTVGQSYDYKAVFSQLSGAPTITGSFTPQTSPNPFPVPISVQESTNMVIKALPPPSP